MTMARSSEKRREAQRAAFTGAMHTWGWAYTLACACLIPLIGASVPASTRAALVDLWLSWEHGGEAAMRVHVARSADGFAITSGDEARLGWHGNAKKLGYYAKPRHSLWIPKFLSH